MSAPGALPGERIAGIDFGSVRIGIALADVGLGIATPYENYARRGPALDADYFRQLAQRERIARFVVGLPVHLDGRESAKSAEARRFGQWLAEATGLAVEYFDERFTTSEAESLLLEAGLSKKARRARLDKLAAQIMLTAYLESRGRQAGPPRGLDD
jgi:putative Holliday junction resolvase